MKYRSYPVDPVLIRSGYRCECCGADLLGDLDTFVSFVRAHVVPPSAGGVDHNENRMACCAACARLKADQRSRGDDDGCPTVIGDRG